jgi:hypothetical protein
LFSLQLLPVVFALIVLGTWRRGDGVFARTVLIRLLWWGLPLGVICLACFLPALLSDDPGSLFRAHVIAAFRSHEFGRRLFDFLKTDWPMFCLVAIGLGVAATTRRLVALSFGLWFMTSLAVLFCHSPVWHHHVTLLAIPGSALAGIAVDYVATRSTRRGMRPCILRCTSAFIVLLSIFLTFVGDSSRPGVLLRPQHYSCDSHAREAEGVIREHLGPRKRIVSADNTYAFNTRSNVPPALSVTSRKRFRAGLIDAWYIIEEIESFQPDIVLLTDGWKDLVRADIISAISKEYKRVYEKEENHRLEIFVRRK